MPLDEGEALSDVYDYFDIAFIGANGVSDKGWTVLKNKEYKRKTESFELAKQRVILCDASKCGITLNGVLGAPDAQFDAIMDRDETNEEFNKVYGMFQDKMKLV